MSTLKDVLLQPDRRPQLVSDCERLVESEVSQKSGLTGLAIKGAFTVVKAVKPAFVRESIDYLIDEFVERLEPFYVEWQHQGAFEAFLKGRATRVADALLGVTDKRAGRVKNPTIKKAYEKLRPSAQKHVEAAIPGVARVIGKFAR